jgi:hypothetical protein
MSMVEIGPVLVIVFQVLVFMFVCVANLGCE